MAKERDGTIQRPSKRGWLWKPLSVRRLSANWQHCEVHPTRITTWKRQRTESAAGVFGKSSSRDQGAVVKALHARIGQLTMENDCFESSLTKAGRLSAKR